MALRKLSQSLKFFLAVLVTVFSSGLMPSAVAYADHNPNHQPGPDPKVFVCKYVGTPGVNETLQTGQNPISVSVNSIPNYQGVGSYFADQQGQSFVLMEDNTAPGPDGDPDVSACPLPQNYVTPTAPTFNDPCGIVNDHYTIPNVANVIYKVSGVIKSPGTYPMSSPVTVTAEAASGFTLATGATSSWSYSFTNVECITVVTPVEPTQTPICGPHNDTITVQSQTGITFSSFGWANGSLTLTATAQPGYILTGTTQWIFTDQNTPCPIPVTPEVPTVTDVCGTENDSITLPTTVGVVYAQTTNQNGSITVTAAPEQGYIFTNGATAEWTFRLTDKPCKVVICHRTNAVVNPYNKIEVSVEAADGQAGNSGNQPDHYGEHQGPVFDPSVHDNGDDWGDIIPPIDGAHNGYNWTAEGQAIYYNNCNVPDDGEGEPDLSFDYGDVCTEDTDGEVSIEIDNDGNVAANDLVVNLYDENGTLIDTQTVDVSAGDDVEVEFGGLAEGTYTIRVFDGNTLLSSEELEVDECGGGIIDVCPNLDGIQLVIPDGRVKDDNGDCVTDQCPLVPGIQTNTILCPAGQGGGGQTLGTSTTTPTTPQILSTSTTLPATIPATGGSSNPLMIVLASILAYGVAYLLQGRRQFSRDHA